VPTVPGAMVMRRLPSLIAGSPSETQSALLESPRYFVLSAILSRLGKVLSMLLQIGAGTQDSRELECLGSQPPRQ